MTFDRMWWKESNNDGVIFTTQKRKGERVKESTFAWMCNFLLKKKKENSFVIYKFQVFSFHRLILVDVYILILKCVHIAR